MKTLLVAILFSVLLLGCATDLQGQVVFSSGSHVRVEIISIEPLTMTRSYREYCYRHISRFNYGHPPPRAYYRNHYYRKGGLYCHRIPSRQYSHYRIEYWNPVTRRVEYHYHRTYPHAIYVDYRGNISEIR